MKNLLIKALFTGCLFMSVLPGVSQTGRSAPEFVYRYWNNQNGLPQNTVYDLLEDSIGYLWGATEEGLFRFDGSRFFVINNGNTPGLQSNIFYSLRRQGNYIWAASRNMVLRVKNEVEKLFDFSDKVGGGWIKCLEVDNLGVIWVGTSTGLLYQIRNDSVYRFAGNTPPPFNSIEMLRATSNTIWLGSQQGLFALDARDSVFKPVSALAGIPVTAIASDSSENIWLATADRGVLRVAANDTTRFTTVEDLPEKFVNTLYFDPGGRLWIGLRSTGFMIYDSGQLYRPAQNNIEHDGVRSVIVTNGNIAWLGTTSSGLALLRSALINRLPDSSNVAGQIALAVYQDDNEDMWVGSPGRGVTRIKDGKGTRYTTANGLSNNLVLAVTSRDDYVYVGTSGGLDRFNKKTNRFDKHFTAGGGLRSSYIVALLRDSKNRIWVAARLGGLSILNPDETITGFDLPTEQQNSNLLGFMEDSKGSIWIGSRGSGIFRILPDNRAQHFHTAQDFPADIVYDFFEDEDGDIWMCSDKGLIVHRNNQFFLFDRDAGLHFNETYRIMQDSKKQIWLSGNLGLQRISWQELKQAKQSEKKVRMAVRLFNEFDGMPNSEANGGFYPAGWKTKDQTLWFPTIGGVAVVDPNLITREDKALDIHIQALQFGDQRFYPGTEIELPAGVYNFEITYASINFSNAADIRYSYRLKGLDNSWTDAGNRQVAYFSALPPGNYTFEVMAQLYGDTSLVQTISFFVAPYFYQTVWFKILLAAAVIAIGVGIVVYFRRMAQRRLREQQLVMRAQMEGQEKERQVISAELHDSINQQLSTAKIYLDYARANEKEREELIGRSAEVVTRAIQEIRSLCYSLTPVGLKDMGLKEAVEDLCRSYTSVGKLNIEFNYYIGDLSLTEDLQFVLYRIIQEQMNNIARHSKAEYVRIELEYDTGNILVLISDDGVGFNPDTVREGLGFANMRNRVSVYKGKIEVDTAPGQGCRLIVKIPKR